MCCGISGAICDGSPPCPDAGADGPNPRTSQLKHLSYMPSWIARPFQFDRNRARAPGACVGIADPADRARLQRDRAVLTPQALQQLTPLRVANLDRDTSSFTIIFDAGTVAGSRWGVARRPSVRG
jgi:hypothetical protein